MDEILNLEKVAAMKTHWTDPHSPNPCKEEFVGFCIGHFSVGRELYGPEDTYDHFHRWVNEQAFPGVIPKELTGQMWKKYEKRRSGLKYGFAKKK